MSGFRKAVKEQRRARVFLYGPSGSGKTWTALTWARELGKRVGLVDTEHGSALAYADDFEFDHYELNPPYSVHRYIAAIEDAVQAGFDVLIVDSLSHAWSGKGGLLEQVDNYGRQHRGDTFGGWRDVTPQHQLLIDALTAAPLHIIGTARAKTKHEYQKDERGKLEVVKLGLEPVQRDGLDYEFDVVAELTVPDNHLIVTKTRCSALNGYAQEKPDGSAAQALAAWLGTGAPPPTVDELRQQAFVADQTLDSLLALHGRVAALGLLTAPALEEDDETPSTLGDIIAARGRALRNQTAGAA